jgi:hypothetical protein
MSEDHPTFAEVGEENVRQYLRRRMERYTEEGGIAEIRVPVIDLTGENA